jgi:hypothetical protein
VRNSECGVRSAVPGCIRWLEGSALSFHEPEEVGTPEAGRPYLRAVRLVASMRYEKSAGDRRAANCGALLIQSRDTPSVKSGGLNTGSTHAGRMEMPSVKPRSGNGCPLIRHISPRLPRVV